MTSHAELAGNGVLLVRERAMAARMQQALERLYRLDRVANVDDFVQSADAGEREALLVRQGSDGALEVSVLLPRLPRPGEPRQGEGGAEMELDGLCQIIEGVSHFVYLAECARAGRTATQLELELQAEVDKWVVLAASMPGFDVDRSASLRSRLYERVVFVHAPGSELGERYRLANEAAHGFVRRLERDYVDRARFGELQGALWRFFHVGQEGKLRLGRAA